MKNPVFNPYLPSWEYVPDGEPHVFGDRIYLYGSHDKANSERFCVQDYTVWSAPVDDLSDWKCHGVSYRKDQDPRSLIDKPVDLYAPDCVQGNDGKYYLYYFAAGPNAKAFGPMSVAVSERPEGPFEYLGDIRYPDGRPLMKYLTNDPAVINDEGRIWLYYGWGLGRDFRSAILKPLYDFVLSKLCNRTLKDIRNTHPSILSCTVVELEDDMLTVKSEPKAVLDSKTTADKDSELYHHAFYEAASIRKFNGLYYLIYSSGENNELAYATSRYPDRDFRYRGVIISNSDLGYQGNRIAKNNAGTIHGSIEMIKGQYYIFYHRCTNNTDFSRQACAERIEIAEDGMVEQVEMTSCGMGDKSLKGIGKYPASICCNLITRKTIRPGIGGQQSLPRISEENGIQYLADLVAGTEIVYKYFDLSQTSGVSISARGKGTIRVKKNDIIVDSDDYQNHFCQVSGSEKEAFTMTVTAGRIDVAALEFKGR
ncbi:MAG: family 43 glycosylhydrolase [Erysipelotrichaceae bacterium]|nr:family 43 glycosylhydrolase [Erysipelotrichaceae bacterium]